MSARVLFLVTHLMGNGHLVRIAAIARACLERGLAVRLITGGFPIATLDLGGLDVVQLEPVRSAGLNFRRLLDRSGEDASAALLEHRLATISQVVRDFAPDVLVTELWPFGRRILGAEFERALEESRRCIPHVAWFVSLRDVLVPPSRPDRVSWVESLVVRGGAQILVHGDRALLPLEASLPVSAELGPRLHYTGYVAHASAPNGSRRAASSAGPVVVSGGGGVTSLELLEAAAVAARLDPDRTEWRLLAGPGVPADVLERIRSRLPSWALIERSRADFRALLAQSRLSISQFGYNTAMDLLQTQCRAIVVPFEAPHDREQRIRADAFASRGWIGVLPADQLSGASLLEATRKTLAGPPPTASGLRLDGASRTALILSSALAACRGAA